MWIDAETGTQALAAGARGPYTPEAGVGHVRKIA